MLSTRLGEARGRRRGYGWAVLCALTSTVVAILLKQQGAYLNTWVATWLRISPYLLVLALVPRRWFGHPQGPARWHRAYALPLVGGVVCYVIGNYLFQWGIDAGLLTVVVPVNQVMTVGMAAAFGWWLLRDRLSRWFGLGAALMLVGLVVANWVNATAPLGHGSRLSWPEVSLLAMASGMAFAVGSLSLRWASARGLDTYRVMWANGTGATVVLTLVVAGLTWRHGWGSLAIGSAWLWVFAAGIMNGVTNMALTQALRYAPVGGVTAIQAGAVPLTGLVAEVAFGEGGGLVAIAASLAAIVGITLAARDPTPLVPNQERELSS